MEFKIAELKNPFKALHVIMLVIIVPIIIYTMFYNGSDSQAESNYKRLYNKSISGKIRSKERDHSLRGFRFHLTGGNVYFVNSHIYNMAKVGDSIYKKSHKDSLYIKKRNGLTHSFDVVGWQRDLLEAKK